MIKTEFVDNRNKPFTPTQLKRLQKAVIANMEQSGQSGLSLSGCSAQMAIDWCLEKGYGYKLSVAPNRQGYYVEAIKDE